MKIIKFIACLAFIALAVYMVWYRSHEKASSPIATSSSEKKVEKSETSKGIITLEVTLNPTFAPSNTQPIPVATKNVSTPGSK